jgi:hypothetical protein
MRDLVLSPKVVVQKELTKIAFLKAEILRTHLVFKDLDILTIESIMADLQKWYGQLPAEMHISNLGLEELPTNVRRSVCHVHLLYLGAIMLLFRRVLCQTLRTHGLDKDCNILCKPLQSLGVVMEDGLVAAKHFARILGLLLAEDGIFKRCWLVMFVVL